MAVATNHEGKSSSQSTPDPVWLRRATALIWLGIIALELPHQFAPRLPPLGNPRLWIIGDSVTAGAGAQEKHLWPDLLPESIEVHNLAQPGATTATALQRQVRLMPAEGGLVLIEIGGNDLLGETSSAAFERDLDALLSGVAGSAGASPSQRATAGLPNSAARVVVMFELPLPPLCN
jgi:acyl-CoA thioesterase-1